MNLFALGYSEINFIRPYVENIPVIGPVNSVITWFTAVTALSSTIIKSPFLKKGFSYVPLSDCFLYLNFLLSIGPSVLNLIILTGPLRTFAPPAKSTASFKTLDLATVISPGLLTLPVTNTDTKGGERLDFIDLVKLRLFSLLDFFYDNFIPIINSYILWNIFST